MTSLPRHLAPFLAAAGLLGFALQAQAETLSGRARVIDGDTLAISGQRVRLNGIDAPETRQTCSRDGSPWACGKASTQAMRQLIGQNPVRCEVSNRDKYGRAIGACFVQDTDLQQQLVRQGLALAYRKYSTRYVSDEGAARAAGVGLWSGDFVPPWEWRKQRDRVRQPARKPSVRRPQSPAAPACRIKGNISSSGRIYHVPGGQYYAQTRINTSNGERWFCSEAEARAAGWRRAWR